jgi:hypothetical protein
MTKWLALLLLAAVLCCASAARAQSTVSAASVSASLPASLPAETDPASVLTASSTPAIRLAPATPSTPVIYSTPEINAGPVRGGHEMEVWVSHSRSLFVLSESVNDNLLQVGGRYGWILTDPIGRGPLRGQLEYAVNFIPLVIPFQSTGPTYGFGLDPITMKWNFQRRHNIIPYAELSAGGIAVLQRVPPLGSHWDFTASGGFGAQIIRGRYFWSIDARFYHVSDAGLIANDPSLGTIEVRVGFGVFRSPRTPWKPRSRR